MTQSSLLYCLFNGFTSAFCLHHIPFYVSSYQQKTVNNNTMSQSLKACREEDVLWRADKDGNVTIARIRSKKIFVVHEGSCMVHIKLFFFSHSKSFHHKFYFHFSSCFLLNFFTIPFRLFSFTPYVSPFTWQQKKFTNFLFSLF